jgi:diguanylate cyclase (GGDEF)-like protein
MNVLDILIDNYVFIYELGGLFILLFLGVHLSERAKRLTRVVIFLMAAETVMFYLERWTQTFERLSLWRPMLTAAIYSIYPLILVILTLITATNRTSKLQLILVLIPEFISVPLYFTSQWTHLIFYYHEDINTYSGGVPGLANWPYYLFAFYALVFLVQNVIYFKNDSVANRLTIAYITAVPLAGAFILMMQGGERDYNSLFISAILLYYVYVYTYMAKVDPLTRLLNRQSYYRIIRSKGRTVTGVVSADMNDLKPLNDARGHEAGDLALQTVADIMRRYCGRTGTVYRVGGDEFMILYTGAGEEEVSAAIAQMQREMEKTGYTCAFGYAMIERYMPLKEAIRESDQRMFANKARMKGQNKGGQKTK